MVLVMNRRQHNNDGYLGAKVVEFSQPAAASSSARPASNARRRRKVKAGENGPGGLRGALKYGLRPAMRSTRPRRAFDEFALFRP